MATFLCDFYQALSTGRIPVLVNTDMELPFKDIIDWNKYIVFEKNEAKCLEKVVSVFEFGLYKNAGRLFQCFSTYFTSEYFFDQLILQLVRNFCKTKVVFQSLFTK